MENAFGDVFLTARGGGDNLPSANLMVASGLSGLAVADAVANTNASTRIDVTDSRIKARDIHLYAGRNAMGVSNHLFSKANVEVLTASLLPSIGVPTVEANITETNTIIVGGNATLLAVEDVELYATQGLLAEGGLRADGFYLSLSLVPYGKEVPSSTSYSNTNQVNVAATAYVEAGINSHSIVQIHPVTFPGQPTFDTARYGTEPTQAEKTLLGIPQEIDYVYDEFDVQQITFDIRTGHMMQVVDGANQGGTVGHYYAYRPHTIEEADTIVPQNEDYSDAVRWLDWGALTQQQVDDLGNAGIPVYDSDVTLQFAAGLDQKFYVVKPRELDTVRLSYVNIGNLLFEQRNQILSWITDHAGDPEALARYQVQLELIDATLEDLGLLEETGVAGVTSVKKELDTVFVSVPAITSSPGSIFIEAAGASSGSFNPLVGSSLVAHAGAKVNVLNKSPFTMAVDDIILRDNRRVTTDAGGNYLVLEPGNVYLNKSPLTSVTDTTEKLVSIIQSWQGDISDFDLTGLPPGVPGEATQDLYINGDVINEDGDVYINNEEGSIIVTGEVRGEQVTILAAGDFTLNSDDWYHTNQDPRQYLDWDIFRTEVFDAAHEPFHGPPPEILTFADATFDDGQQTLAQAIVRDESKVLAHGRIAITARYLNIDGLVQSGVDSIQLEVAADFQPPEFTSSLTAEGTNQYVPGEPLPGISFGTEGVPVAGYWDATRQAIVLEDIEPQGGEIIVAGQILSTGHGRLKVASGLTSVDIDNESPYRLLLGRIDTTSERIGKNHRHRHQHADQDRIYR